MFESLLPLGPNCKALICWSEQVVLPFRGGYPSVFTPWNPKAQASAIRGRGLAVELRVLPVERRALAA